MKIAILSDIHGNLEALEAVCADLKSSGAEMVLCLGDLIGYGPDPEAVVTRIRRLGYVAILGNHEAALTSSRILDSMNFQARENNISTKALLSAESLHYCCQLPRTITMEGALFVHGCPPDSITAYLYLMPDERVEDLFENDPRQLFFVGHTHQLRLVYLDSGRVVRDNLDEGVRMLSREQKYLINCGSVGQPRDRDSRAKYLIWDSSAWSVKVRAVRYDVEKTAEKIVRRGFPISFADRLR